MSLGPVKLPGLLPAISFVSDYHRFGKRKPAEFLKEWYDTEKNSWKYPKSGGFVLDSNGNSISGEMTLLPGTMVDRFGDETGKFVFVADAPFNQRSIPPSNLNTKDGAYPWEYHVYKVVKYLKVKGGPVAPAFEQPGLGAQFYVGDSLSPAKDKGKTTIMDLLSHDNSGPYLEKVPKKEIDIGAGPGCECGR